MTVVAMHVVHHGCMPTVVNSHCICACLLRLVLLIVTCLSSSTTDILVWTRCCVGEGKHA